jgi:hypothetical protein
MYRLHTPTCYTPEIHLRLDQSSALFLSDFTTDILCAYLKSTTEFNNNVSSKSLGISFRPSFRCRLECTSTQSNSTLVYFNSRINKNKTMPAVWRPSPEVYVSFRRLNNLKAARNTSITYLLHHSYETTNGPSSNRSLQLVSSMDKQALAIRTISCFTLRFSRLSFWPVRGAWPTWSSWPFQCLCPWSPSAHVTDLYGT